eukprot:m.71173 g.71173  ORF g.71173 m.71173 type:complete len:572 (+) comp12220_c0_seq1:163-1878(+)
MKALMFVLAFLSACIAIIAFDDGSEKKWLSIDGEIAQLVVEAELGHDNVANFGENLEDVNLDDFKNKFLTKEAKPFISHNSSRWSHLPWGTPSEFLESVSVSNPDQPVMQVRWSAGANQVGPITRNSSLRSFVLGDLHFANSGLLFENVQASKSWKIPPIFKKTGLGQTILSVGSAGQGLPFHNHAYAWQSTVIGAKLFLFLPPLNRDFWGNSLNEEMRQKAILDDLIAKFAKIILPDPRVIVKLFLKQFMEEVGNSVQLQHVIVYPGDVVFIPCNWYHATLNLADTVAIGGQVAESNWRMQRCPKDAFGAASNLFTRANRELKVNGTKGSPRALEATKQACSLNPYHVECAALESRLHGVMGDYQKSIDVLRQKYMLFQDLVRKKIMSKTIASFLCGQLAETLLKTKEISSQKEARTLSAEIVKKAAELDKLNLNPSAQFMYLTLRFAHAKEPGAVSAAMQYAKTLTGLIEATEMHDLYAVSPERLQVILQRNKIVDDTLQPEVAIERLLVMEQEAGKTRDEAEVFFSYKYGGDAANLPSLEYQMQKLMKVVRSRLQNMKNQRGANSEDL